MDNSSIIKQLEKALEKEDKELRLRIEVLVDMLKEYTFTPVTPLQPYYETLQEIPRPTVTMEDVSQSVIEAKKNPPREIKDTAPKGAGSIISNGEQITYTRPPNT